MSTASLQGAPGRSEGGAKGCGGAGFRAGPPGGRSVHHVTLHRVLKRRRPSWASSRSTAFRRVLLALPPLPPSAARCSSPAARPAAASFLLFLPSSRRRSLLSHVRAGPAGIRPHRPHTSVACPLSRTSNPSVSARPPGRWRRDPGRPWDAAGLRRTRTRAIEAWRGAGSRPPPPNPTRPRRRARFSFVSVSRRAR